MLVFCLPVRQPNIQTWCGAPPLPPSPRASLLLFAEEVEHWLNAQWQTEKYHILLAEDRHIFLTCLQLVGTWMKIIFRNLVPDFLTCPQLVGTWVKNIFRNLVPDFWTCPTAKKGHIYQGGWIFVVRQVFTRGVYNYEI